MSGTFPRLSGIFSQRRVLLFSLAVTAVLILIINRIDSRLSEGGGLGVLFLQIAFTRRDFDIVLASWGKPGIDYYVSTLWIDYFYAVFAAVLISSATSYFRVQTESYEEKPSGKGWAHIFIIPLVYALLEFSENTLHLFIILQRSFGEGMIIAASLVSVAKYFFMLLGIGMMMKQYFRFRNMLRSQGRR